MTSHFSCLVASSTHFYVNVFCIDLERRIDQCVAIDEVVKACKRVGGLKCKKWKEEEGS